MQRATASQTATLWGRRPPSASARQRRLLVLRARDYLDRSQFTLRQLADAHVELFRAQRNDCVLPPAFKDWADSARVH